MSAGLARIAWLVLVPARLYAAHLVYQTNVPANLLAADSAGNAYILNGAGITRLDAAGNIVYSKPLPLPGQQFAMTVDSAGNVFVVGDTNSDSLPTTPTVFQPKRSPGVCITGDRAAQPYPCPDAFVAKIGPGGALVWASYLGGLNIDQANGVAVDAAGSVYVTGFTLSGDFPTAGAFQPQFGGYADAFVTKISADGTKILYSSFLGASGYDVSHAIAVDSAGNAYLAGALAGGEPAFTSAGFGIPCAADSVNAFLAKVSPGGERLIFAGCLGAAFSYSEATAVAVDPQGNIYVAGETNSSSFPATPGAFQSTGHSPYIDFAVKVAPDGSALAYSALFAGASFGIYSIAADAGGAVYLSGPASPALPIAGPAMQPCPGSYFLLKLNAAGSAPLYSSFDEAARFAPAPDGSVILGGAAVERLAALESPGDSFLSPECVLNAASLASHLAYGQPGISPGEIVALKGTGLGPPAPSVPTAANGILGNLLGGTQVFFDGVAAPLMYVGDAQINVVAPYSLAGKTATAIQVAYQGRRTVPVSVPVSAISAALFERSDGTPFVLNPDYSENSQTNPVARGGLLILYMTGAGQTVPASVDGQIWQTAAGLEAPVSATLTSYGYADKVMATVPVLYAGPAPTLVSGVQQFNIAIPADLPDSFVTPAIGIASVVVVQIGSGELSFSVYVR
jgi:uncharacterized protein (TIGR03437 family)